MAAVGLGVKVAVESVSAAEGESRRFDLGGGVELEVVKITAGTFTMGSPETEAGRNGDERAHQVTLSRDFYLGATAVTVAQWERFVAETNFQTETETGSSGGFGWNGKALEQRPEFTWRNPGFGQDQDHPVVLVTWEDAQEFLKWLSAKTQWNFVLPWEAQWEYACRAGSSTAWWTGSDPKTAGQGLWSKESSENRTHAVTSLPANPWGLRISGNVWEWCADWYGPYASGDARDPVQGTPTLEEKPRRVLRGGSWLRPLKVGGPVPQRCPQPECG
jgi:formylglycine-generating enzyme required for sulfatase activity